MGLSIIVYGRLPSGGRHSRERRNPATHAAGLYRKKPNPHRLSFPQKLESKNATQQEFIGKTEPPHRRHSRAGGNPETQRGRTYRKKPKPHRPSFPRRRNQTWHGNFLYSFRPRLDSAFAGMTVGGVSVFSDKVLPRCVSGFPPARE
ncbi:putative phage associated protein [Neisseria meningitidis]|nr:putative phage associated protein [Neisseria meningitidis]